MNLEADIRAAAVLAARDDLQLAAPVGALDRILARREAGERRILPDASFAGTSSRSMVGRAAAIILLCGAVAAAMILPVSKWLAPDESPDQAIADRPAPASPAIITTAPPTTAASRVAGVSIPGTAERLSVIVVGATSRLRIRVRLVDAGELEVRGVGEAADATFKPSAQEISVGGAKGW
jgi:hypothetical protein